MGEVLDYESQRTHFVTVVARVSEPLHCFIAIIYKQPSACPLNLLNLAKHSKLRYPLRTVVNSSVVFKAANATIFYVKIFFQWSYQFYTGHVFLLLNFTKIYWILRYMSLLRADFHQTNLATLLK